MKVRTKPIEKEAIQYTGENITEVLQFTGAAELENDFLENSIEIPTLEGRMKAMPGDWIIRGVEGEYYPCKSGIFEKTYEKVEG